MAQDWHDNYVQSDSPSISWPLNRPKATGQWQPPAPQSMPDVSQLMSPLSQDVLYSEVLPGQAQALDGISLRSFLLGLSLGMTSLLALFCASHDYRVWRPFCFVAALSLFHFLEFYITAGYNTRYANIGAFLLSQNGTAYNMAHSIALLECIVTSIFFPTWQARFSDNKIKVVGLITMIIGQTTRSMAMAQAGTNFNHTVQTRKSEGHQLVKNGIYEYLRHPSYFGFFWWGIGTQVVLGNTICFLGYTGILWKFFSSRIQKEEEFLIKFFENEYEEYRSQTPVGIPFIS